MPKNGMLMLNVRLCLFYYIHSHLRYYFEKINVKKDATIEKSNATPCRRHACRLPAVLFYQTKKQKDKQKQWRFVATFFYLYFPLFRDFRLVLILLRPSTHIRAHMPPMCFYRTSMPYISLPTSPHLPTRSPSYHHRIIIIGSTRSTICHIKNTI